MNGTSGASLRIGVIGAGNMGRHHVRVLADTPSAELVGVADANLAAAGAAASRFGIPIHDDYRRLFDERGPEAVVVAVPTVDHHRVAMDAIERGIHVLVEKPIAASVAQAEELIETAARRGVVLAVGHIERFNPAVIELKARLEAGELGQPFMVHARRQSPYPQRIHDVGVASDLATHELDMMRYLVGCEVSAVSAEVSHVLDDSDREDIVFGILRFANGVLGVLDVNWVTPTAVREISITGERGMFVVNYLTQELTFHENSGARKLNDGGKWEFTVNAGHMIRYHILRREPLRSELESFVACARSGARPVVDGIDGLRALELAATIMNLKKSESVVLRWRENP